MDRRSFFGAISAAIGAVWAARFKRPELTGRATGDLGMPNWFPARTGPLPRRYEGWVLPGAGRKFKIAAGHIVTVDFRAKA
jgi:hypothetical protein